MDNGFPEDYGHFRLKYESYIAFGLSSEDAIFATTEFDGLINYEGIGLEEVKHEPISFSEAFQNEYGRRVANILGNKLANIVSNSAAAL